MPPRRSAVKAARVVAEKEQTPPPPPQSRRLQPYFWLLAALAVLLAALLARAAVSTHAPPLQQPAPVAVGPPPQVIINAEPEPRRGLTLVSREQLAQHDGSRPDEAIWLALCGQVFDVSRNTRHYGPGGGYAGFAGRDGTRAFVSGEFTQDGLVEDVAGLSDEDAAGLLYWRDFYTANYTFVGLLAGGAFYDAQGQPLPPVAALEAGAARRQALLQRVAAETRVAPSCNAAWSAEAGSEVWCDEGRLPRRATYPHNYPPRCLCIAATLEAGVAAAEAGMEMFTHCAHNARRCKTTDDEGRAGTDDTAAAGG